MSENKPVERERKAVSNKIVVIAVIVASLLFALGIWVRSRPDAAESSAAAEASISMGSLQAETIDGLTGGPLSGATVVIPETGKTYQTDEAGKTPVIELPVSQDKTYEKILRKPWGEITILVYKDGYVPYALFHAQIPLNQTRQGPRIYLFPQSSVQSDQPFSVVEGPPRTWVNELISKYAPP